MAYKTSQLEDQSLKVIKEKSLIFIDDIVVYLPCNRATFYNHKLDKLDTIKDALEFNKTETKIKLRTKWEDSDNATLQLALMRLICSDTERRKLAINYTEITGKDGATLFQSMTEQEKQDIVKKIKNADKGNRNTYCI